ncbi:peptidoglycan-binding domain-containing protein [Salininema proteolyticum]|uniref:Peptidoglycan-binding protein n=1 Tax=Salininema proteolyticum TaxID=1607685 RepID=A0ABV8TWR5_9ACTN
MSWRLARSLERLRDEINALAPGRSTRSDGTIGDDAHKGTRSDHNPNDSGVVCALDITHDPAAGVDIDALTDHLVHPKYRHPCLKYAIANKLIASASTGWKWVRYNGSNPHTSHMHISVGRGPDGSSRPPYDNTRTWHIADLKDDGGTKPSKRPAPGPKYDYPLPKGFYFGWSHWGNESISGWYGEQFSGRPATAWLNLWGKQLRKRGWNVGKGRTYLRRYGLDGKYGDEWHALARAFQKDQDLQVDGLIGPQTWRAAFHNPVT